jgi:hypothetical protein
MARLPRLLPVSLISLLVLVIPVSPNYNLRELNVGGGGDQSQSANYRSEQTIGELGSPMQGTNFGGGLGFGFTQMANVPPAPTLTNPSNYYNRLHVIIANGGNPSDTLFAIAISSDDFVTTRYVKSDQAIGSSLTLSDYQTYASWGGGSGFDILGLAANTTYKVKVKAMQGDFSESGYGPTASAATDSLTLIFDIDVAATDTPTSPPYVLSLGTLLAGTVTTGSDKIWASLETNGQSGANIYIAGQNAGLLSGSTSYSLASTTGDLDSLPEGFGLQGSSATQSSGGPLTIASPFNSGSDQVGGITTAFQTLFTTAGPITAGRGSAVLKAKASSNAPAKSDYSETLTVISAVNF